MSVMKNAGSVRRICSGIAVVLLANAVRGAPGKEDSTHPNARFEIRNIQGWTVYINKKDLVEHKEDMDKALEHLEHQFYQVALAVPRAAAAIMRERVPVWVEYDTIGIAYHARTWLVQNGYHPPDVKTMAGFCSMKKFLHVALDQPWVVFHELAHGYDHRYLRTGNRGGHPAIGEAYKRAAKSGTYKGVLCRYAKSTRHYGMNNKGEYFAENSEAYFGANDFYPFVRAELKEHDPEMYNALQTTWGVDREEEARNINSLVQFMESRGKQKCPASAGGPKASGGGKDAYVPTSQYRKCELDGWTVYVSPKLHRMKAYSDEVCKLLRHKLHWSKRYLPAPGVKELQKVPIWLELDSSHVPYMTYHSSAERLKRHNQNPDKLRAVEIGCAGMFVQWRSLQPYMVLHQLAYAYYDRVLGSGNARIKAGHQKAVKGGKYKSVLRFDGKHVRHPALIDEREYFAEMTEARFGINDHYPFLRFELKQFDPHTYDLISAIWSSKS